jgi:hypothetical protein
MKTKWFSSSSYSGFIKVNTLDDMIDLNRFPFRSFKTIKEVTRKTNERTAELKAKQILSDFFGMVAHDMIDDRAVFLLPVKRFGFMRIGDIGRDPGAERYNARIQDDFMVPGGKIHLDPLIKKINGGKDYRFKMIRPLHERLRENKYKGVRYVK